MNRAIDRIRDINLALVLITGTHDDKGTGLPQQLSLSVELATKSFEVTTETAGFKLQTDVAADFLIEDKFVRPVARLLWRVLKTIDRTLQKQKLQEAQISCSQGSSELCVTVPGLKLDTQVRSELGHLDIYFKSLGSSVSIDTQDPLIIRISLEPLLIHSKLSQTSQAPLQRTASS